MNPKSSNALIGAAALSLFVGMLVMSPHASLFLYGLAAVFVAVPTIFGDRKRRIVSGALLAASLALAVGVYPKYAEYLDRVKAKTSTSSPANPSPSPLPAQEQK
jgi:hypothetical protein